MNRQIQVIIGFYFRFLNTMFGSLGEKCKEEKDIIMKEKKEKKRRERMMVSFMLFGSLGEKRKLFYFLLF